MRTLTFLAAALTLPAQPIYDLIVKGGHVIDPKNRLNGIMDIAVAGGKISKVAADIPAAEGRKIIDQSGLTMISAETLAEGAQKAVAAAKTAKAA